MGAQGGRESRRDGTVQTWENPDYDLAVADATRRTAAGAEERVKLVLHNEHDDRR
jgi:hypothetical protein